MTQYGLLPYAHKNALQLLVSKKCIGLGQYLDTLQKRPAELKRVLHFSEAPTNYDDDNKHMYHIRFLLLTQLGIIQSVGAIHGSVDLDDAIQCATWAL